jgi:hypothetical protein
MEEPLCYLCKKPSKSNSQDDPWIAYQTPKMIKWIDVEDGNALTLHGECLTIIFKKFIDGIRTECESVVIDRQFTQETEDQ